jgi:hypothetical protein
MVTCHQAWLPHPAFIEKGNKGAYRFLSSVAHLVIDKAVSSVKFSTENSIRRYLYGVACVSVLGGGV